MVKFSTKEERNELLAKELIDFLVKREYTENTHVYWNGKRMDLATMEVEQLQVTDYLEYCNPEGVSLSYEGHLYHDLNYGGSVSTRLVEKIDSIAKKYGLYHELGYAWSMSFYEL